MSPLIQASGRMRLIIKWTRTSSDWNCRAFGHTSRSRRMLRKYQLTFNGRNLSDSFERSGVACWIWPRLWRWSLLQRSSASGARRAGKTGIWRRIGFLLAVCCFASHWQHWVPWRWPVRASIGFICLAHWLYEASVILWLGAGIM